MMTLLLPLAAFAAIAVVGGAIYAVAIQSPSLRPATVYPFAPGSTDPSADTMAGQACIETVFNDNGWNALTLHRLNEVEDLLDSLEAHSIVEREVKTLDGNTFCVRWR